MLKTAIVLLVLALLASLGSGFYFLMTDQGDKKKRRTLHSLGVRLAIAASLMALIFYGVATGQLGHTNPWDAGPKQQQSKEAEATATPK
ncbi:MAG: DUF2909 domain-containing protein [Halioglobus sp.]